jgi:hypothetical protein
MPADNPQQSEEASHIGHQGKCKCRKCHAGEECGFEATIDNYGEFYQPGRLRNVKEIRDCVLRQIDLATRGVARHVVELQTSTGVKDKIAEYWIEKLLEKSREEAKDHTKSTDEISALCHAWLREQTDRPYNALLDMPSM